MLFVPRFWVDHDRFFFGSSIFEFQRAHTSGKRVRARALSGSSGKRAPARMEWLRRAGGAAWMDPSREHFAARIPDPRPQLAPDSQGRARQLRAAECNLAGPGSVRQQCAAEACPAAARVRTHRLRTQARAARTGLDESGAERGGAAAQRTQRERRGPGQQARLGRRARRG